MLQVLEIDLARVPVSAGRGGVGRAARRRSSTRRSTMRSPMARILSCCWPPLTCRSGPDARRSAFGRAAFRPWRRRIYRSSRHFQWLIEPDGTTLRCLEPTCRLAARIVSRDADAPGYRQIASLTPRAMTPQAYPPQSLAVSSRRRGGHRPAGQWPGRRAARLRP